MLRNKPAFEYCGLTIVLSHPSRFDVTNNELLSANGGKTFFNNKVLQPEFNKWQCDIRVKEDTSELLPNTRCILLLGDASLQKWLPNVYWDNSLGALRGTIFKHSSGVPTICSYFPQDCVDLKNYEKEHNAEASEEGDFSDDDSDESAEDSKRRHGKTKRRNFGFWLECDIKKVKHILRFGVPEVVQEPEYILYPGSDTIRGELERHKNETLYFDMEYDSNLNMQCFSFSFGLHTNKVYCVPCLLPDYSWAYSSLPLIYRSLSVAVRDNTLVAHNGANADLFNLGYKYRIPVGPRVYDTMIAQHRLFPEQEKSLGHCITYHTWLPFHKDEDAPYNSMENAKKKWLYCGKDVFSMMHVHAGQIDYASRRPGLLDSIEQGNASIVPYLTSTFQGISIDEPKIAAKIAENDRLMFQYIRLLEILVGKPTVESVRSKNSKAHLIASPDQQVKYFHELLGYKPVGYGKVREDGTQRPSLGKKNIYRLKLKYPNNAAIDVIMKYREVAKETSTLQISPWKL